jgi:bifunctional enzyme Fae/Hps
MGRSSGLERIKIIREAFPNKKFLIAVAGGIFPETAKEALEQDADILIVGRYVTQSKDIERSVRDFLELTPSMRETVDLYRVIQNKNKTPSESLLHFFFFVTF